MTRSALWLVVVWMMGCATTGGSATSDPPMTKGEPLVASPPGGPAKKGGETLKAPPAASEELVGVLSYTAVRTDVMSVDAFLGDKIVLTTDKGPNKLVATEAVPKVKLQALDGHKVKVTARWSEGSLPDPNSAHPMDGDEPMRQGVGFEVLAIEDQGKP
jgi:hypothetical protein